MTVNNPQPASKPIPPGAPRSGIEGGRILPAGQQGLQPRASVVSGAGGPRPSGPVAGATAQAKPQAGLGLSGGVGRADHMGQGIPGARKAIAPVPAAAGPTVTSDQAMASLISAVLQGGGDGGKAAVAWHKQHLAQAKTAPTATGTAKHIMPAM
jgi:hypothetical protein